MVQTQVQYHAVHIILLRAVGLQLMMSSLLQEQYAFLYKAIEESLSTSEAITTPTDIEVKVNADTHGYVTKEYAVSHHSHSVKTYPSLVPSH